jgi:hypothetical protein
MYKPNSIIAKYVLACSLEFETFVSESVSFGSGYFKGLHQHLLGRVLGRTPICNNLSGRYLNMSTWPRVLEDGRRWVFSGAHSPRDMHKIH